LKFLRFLIFRGDSRVFQLGDYGRTMDILGKLCQTSCRRYYYFEKMRIILKSISDERILTFEQYYRYVQLELLRITQRRTITYIHFRSQTFQ